MCNFRKQNASQSSHSLSVMCCVCVIIMAETSTTNIIDTFRSRVAIKLDFIVISERGMRLM